jgi:type I restriction enzyme S subunit
VDVAELIRGVTYAKDDARSTQEDGYLPVLRATNIQESRLVLDSDLVFVPGANVSANQTLRAGDIVVATSSGSKHLVGKSALLGREWSGSFGAFCAAIRSKETIEPRYLASFLQSPAYWQQIGEKSMGVNINNLRRGDIESVVLPLPDLDEQRRVVAEIEKQFSRLDEAVANLQRVKANLKRYKAAILKAAVEGRLVETEASLARREGRSYETGEQLLQRILEVRRAKWAGRGKYKQPTSVGSENLPELPEGWTWATTDHLTFLVTSGSRGWGDFYADVGVLFIRAQDIKTDELNRTDVARVSISVDAEGTRSSVSKADILVTITGANVTKSALVPELDEMAFVSQHVALMKLCLPEIAAFVFSWIVSPANGRKTLESWAYGAGKPGLSLEQVRALPIALPPLAEQARIVAEVDYHMSIICEVEAEVDANLKRSQTLRQATLRKQFHT